jgi:hypothetical protein
MGIGLWFSREEDRTPSKTKEQWQEFFSTLPELPSEDTFVLMMRDPYAALGYFGFDERTKNKIRQIYGNKAPATIEIKKQEKGLIDSIANYLFPIKDSIEIDLDDLHLNYYFTKVKPENAYQASIKIKGIDFNGMEELLSNVVFTPRNSPAKIPEKINIGYWQNENGLLMFKQFEQDFSCKL